MRPPLNQVAVDAAVRAFREGALGDPALLNEFEEKLRGSCEERYAAARRKRDEGGERLAVELLAAESVKLNALMRSGGASLDAVEAELRR